MSTSDATKLDQLIDALSDSELNLLVRGMGFENAVVMHVQERRERAQDAVRSALHQGRTYDEVVEWMDELVDVERRREWAETELVDVERRRELAEVVQCTLAAEESRPMNGVDFAARAADRVRWLAGRGPNSDEAREDAEMEKRFKKTCDAALVDEMEATVRGVTLDDHDLCMAFSFVRKNDTTTVLSRRVDVGHYPRSTAIRLFCEVCSARGFKAVVGLGERRNVVYVAPKNVRPEDRAVLGL